MCVCVCARGLLVGWLLGWLVCVFASSGFQCVMMEAKLKSTQFDVSESAANC